MVADAYAPGTLREPLLFKLVGIAVLVMSWVQFTGVWFWPPVRLSEWGTLSAHEGGKPGGVLFQYPLWLLISAGSGLAVFRHGLVIVRHLWPFLGLLLIMIVASLLGLTPAASIRITLLWMLSVLSGVVVIALLDRQLACRVLALVILMTMLLSLLLYLLLPAHGGDYYGGARLVLRGLFTHKNGAGRVAAIGLALLFVMRHELSRALFWTAFGITVVCLALTDSKTGWLSAVAAIAFLQLVDHLRHRVTPSLGLVVVLGAGVLALLLAAAMAPFIADAIGRDLTFTGRTAIWSIYIDEIRNFLWLGVGPGNVTDVSPVTVKLWMRLRTHGSIFTPHSFYIATLGDIGLPGLLYTMGLMLFLTLWLPLRDRGPFSLGAAAVGSAALLGGLGETLDAAKPGFTWFALALFWMGYCLERYPHLSRAHMPPPRLTATPAAMGSAPSDVARATTL